MNDLPFFCKKTMNNSKKIILSLAFLALVNIISAQNFYEKTILPPNRIIGQGAIGAMSDFDNDGDMDMLFGGATNQNGIKFHLNNGTTFDSSFFMPIGNLSYFKISDIDVDGDDDIIAWNQGFIAIENLGNFNTSSTNLNIVGASSPMWIEMADMDGDGLEDIVFAQFSGRSIRWSKNLGALSFDTARTLINSQWGTRQITSFRVTDLDNDNDLDIVVRTNRSISQQLFICTDTGSYNYSINQIALSVFTYAIEDFNGDSLKDIAFTSSGNSSRILFNDSNSTFSQSTILRTSPRTGLLDVIESGVYAIDYDQDNDYDLFLCETRNQSQGIGKLYLNNNGSFTATDTTISGGIFNHIGGSKNLR